MVENVKYPYRRFLIFSAVCRAVVRCCPASSSYPCHDCTTMIVCIVYQLYQYTNTVSVFMCEKYHIPIFHTIQYIIYHIATYHILCITFFYFISCTISCVLLSLTNTIITICILLSSLLSYLYTIIILQHSCHQTASYYNMVTLYIFSTLLYIVLTLLSVILYVQSFIYFIVSMVYTR